MNVKLNILSEKWKHHWNMSKPTCPFAYSRAFGPDDELESSVNYRLWMKMET